MAVSTEQRARAVQIRDKAKQLFSRANVGHCESLAQLVEWAHAQFTDVYFGFNNDEETFMEDFNLVLTDRTEWGVSRRKEDMDLYFEYRTARDTCFRDEFRDGGNQVRHFWGYVNFSFHFGRKVGRWATLREGDETADILLGIKGASLGAGLDGIGVSLEEVSQWIRDNICKEGDCFSNDTRLEVEED